MLELGAVLRDGAQVRVINRSRGLLLADRAEVAARPARRMRGLLGRRRWRQARGSSSFPAQAVHTVGMSYPIDVVHVDRRSVVRRVLRRLVPWRLGPIVWRGHLVLELPTGQAFSDIGDELVFEPPAPNSNPSSVR